MAPLELNHRKISQGWIQTYVCEADDSHGPPSRWPRASTIVLSITNLTFAVLALLQALRPINVCLASTFEEGFEIDWGNPNLNLSKLSLIWRSTRGNRDARSDLYQRASF